MASKEKIGSFEENFRKLELLAQELQENKVSIDELVPRMQDALGAIKVCKEVLQETKSQLKQISEEFSNLESLTGNEG
ncbi:MAG TPA: exodeoxyribonuclease VII small subunit [Oligoflexia bacterium]|mgnify:CR=1 FL=1|nr:exodeoxyribonuclease VII small subunit [Oligoflexia bacterium]